MIINYVSPVPHAASSLLSPPRIGNLNALDSLFTPLSSTNQSSLLSSSVQPWSISALRNFAGPVSEYFNTAEAKVEMDPSKTERYEILMIFVFFYLIFLYFNIF